MAFLSDIHGALAPLEAVLEELARREVSDIYVAGDLLLGGDQPLEVWRKLQSVNARCTRGASDTALSRSWNCANRTSWTRPRSAPPMSTSGCAWSAS